MVSSKLILASASPRRLALLEQIGIVPQSVVAAEIDESPGEQELPRAHALRIAVQKATIIQARQFQDDTVSILAADTVVACGRRILPKALDTETVSKCLQLLSGRRHTVITAIAIVDEARKLRTRVVETKVSFRRLDPIEIEEYARAGEGIGKAGGYAIQGHAAVFVRFISGSYSNVVGLPLMETFQLLKACAVA